MSLSRSIRTRVMHEPPTARIASDDRCVTAYGWLKAGVRVHFRKHKKCTKKMYSDPYSPVRVLTFMPRAWMRGVAAAALVVTLVACASTSMPLAPEAYRLEIRDNPAARRFDVMLHSHHDRVMCLDRDSWPTSLGTLFVENAEVYLDTSSGPMPIRSPLKSVYCPGGCGDRRLVAGEVLTGFFAYSAFGDAGQIATDASRRLHFSVTPSECR